MPHTISAWMLHSTSMAPIYVHKKARNKEAQTLKEMSTFITYKCIVFFLSTARQARPTWNTESGTESVPTVYRCDNTFWLCHLRSELEPFGSCPIFDPACPFVIPWKIDTESNSTAVMTEYYDEPGICGQEQGGPLGICKRQYKPKMAMADSVNNLCSIMIHAESITLFCT